jgi:hypothetical protein
MMLRKRRFCPSHSAPRIKGCSIHRIWALAEKQPQKLA